MKLQWEVLCLRLLSEVKPLETPGVQTPGLVLLS